MEYELRIENGFQPYLETMQEMERRVACVKDGAEKSLLWFLEHPALYTAGVGVKNHSFHSEIPLYTTTRGGKVTYHGPGQRVIYFVHKLPVSERDIRKYIYFLEEWLIVTLGCLGINGLRHKDGTGVWVNTASGVEKIGAIGVRLQGWVVSHGISLNIAPNLNHYKDIIPCGIEGRSVTSLKELGVRASMEEVDQILIDSFDSTYRKVMEVCT